MKIVARNYDIPAESKICGISVTHLSNIFLPKANLCYKSGPLLDNAGNLRDLCIVPYLINLMYVVLYLRVCVVSLKHTWKFFLIETEMY